MWRYFGFAAFLLAAPLASVACSDECNRAGDCESGEVCYAGTCTPISADFVACSSNADCDPDGRYAECRAGRCALRGSTINIVDAGMPDTGASDSGVADGGDAGDGG